MTIEKRLEQLEQQNHRIERKNKRLTAALTLMAVAVCAVVTLAATNVRDVSNSDNGRWEFHQTAVSTNASVSQYSLDTKTGDLWRVHKLEKEPVQLKKKK